MWFGQVSCSLFQYKTNPNPRKKKCCGKKRPNCHFWSNFSWVGLALGWGVRRFHNNSYHGTVYVLQPKRILWMANTDYYTKLQTNVGAVEGWTFKFGPSTLVLTAVLVAFSCLRSSCLVFFTVRFGSYVRDHFFWPLYFDGGLVDRCAFTASTWPLQFVCWSLAFWSSGRFYIYSRSVFF